MRTIVHLSDLHFGRIDPAILDPLASLIATIRPDVVVVSGDLTQRARKRLHVSTDGEVSTMTPPLRYRIRPRALAVMLPDPARRPGP